MAITLFGQSTTGSAWKQMEAWRAKQRQFTDEAEAVTASVAATLTSVFTSSSDGLFELTVRRAVAAAQQRAAERAKRNEVDLSI